MSRHCPFCEIAKHDDEKRIIKQNDSAFVMRDGYPVGEGHTLIIPKRHENEKLGSDTSFR